MAEYQANPSETPFNLNKVSLVVQQKELPKPQKAIAEPTLPAAVLQPKEESQDMYSAILASMPQFANLGKLFKSSKPVELTELETEYVVNCVKHIFPKHVVFQVILFLKKGYDLFLKH